jgi:reductive dehalogenase
VARRTPLSKLFIRSFSSGQLPYQLDDQVYQRYDQRNNLTVGRPSWDQKLRAFTNDTRRTAVRLKRIRSGQSGYGLKDYSLYAAAGVVNKTLGTNENHANRGLTSWSPLRAKVGDVAEVGRWEGPPAAATALVKRVARFFGADLVGIALLDKRWIYSHAFWPDGSHKEIVLDSTDVPVETGHEMVIPEKMRWVIVLGARMDGGILQYCPTPTGCAEVHRTYSRMAQLVASVAEFLRGIGYQAIPSLNGLGLNIPMAIDAGFGEQGRHGKLITPEFGPCIRLCKVITDLPLVPDHPIRFGVHEFCQVCSKCAEACPSKAIPTGERTWSGPSISDSPGVYTWHLDNEACRKYFVLGNADPCTICIRVCPFSKSPSLVHDFTRIFISRVPKLNSLWIRLDDLLGYGRQRVADDFWTVD